MSIGSSANQPIKTDFIVLSSFCRRVTLVAIERPRLYVIHKCIYKYGVNTVPNPLYYYYYCYYY